MSNEKNMTTQSENEHASVRELLTLAAAGALDSSEQRRVDEHLMRCESCRTEFRGLGRITKALQEQPMPPLPAGLLLATRRMLEARAQGARERRRNHVMFGVLILLGWVTTLLNWPLLRWAEAPFTRWLNISSTEFTWFCTLYIITIWGGTLLAAALLGQRYQSRNSFEQQRRTL